MIQRFSRPIALFAALALALQIGAPMPAGAANGHDDPGTQITNNATATYKDAAGNTYNTTSNTVTTTVQNAPTLTNTAGTGVTYAPGQVATDTFTLSNTGNGAGYFQISGNSSAPTTSSDAVLGGADAASATLGNGASSCTTPVGSQASPCKYSATVGGTTYYFTSLDGTSDDNSLDYWLKNTNTATAAGASIVVNVYYAISNSATTPGTVTSTIYATVTYPASGSAPAETSTSQSATQSNTINADARLDLYKHSVQNGTTGDITYTISAHNGGAFAAKDLQSVKSLLGASVAGVLLTDHIPQFGGAPLKLSNSGTVTVNTNATYGYATGAVADVYYTTSANGTSGWTKAAGALPTDGSVTYIGVFLHGGTCGTAGYELCADASHPTNPGNSNVASAAAVQIVFTVAQPTGPGSANAASVTNIANGVIGDNQPTEHILGPGIPGGTNDSTSSTPLTTTGQGINNTTNTSVGGASNKTSDQALAAYQPFNGPLGQPQSSGSYDGAVSASTNNDFTAYPFGLSGDNVVNTSTTAGTPTTTVTLGSSQTVCVPNTLQNDGNHDDSFNIIANVPTAYAIPSTSGGATVSGWKVGVYSDSACTAALGGATDGASSSTASNVAIVSGSSLNYYVKFVVPAGAPYFTRYDALVHTVSVGDNTKTNDTHDELYSGFVALTKSQSVTSNGCPSGVSPSYAAGTVCPTGVLQYTVDYRNLVLGTTDTNASFTAVVTQAGSLAITDDGTVTASASSTTTPNWASFAAMNSAPTDSASGSTYTYYSGIPATGAGTSTWSSTATKFVDLVGGASFQLVPKNYLAPSGTQGNQGTVTFSVTVK